MSEGVVALRGVPLRKRARLELRRHLSVDTRRRIKRQLVRLRHGPPTPPAPAARAAPAAPGAPGPPTGAAADGATARGFGAGQLVRVRGREEIEATLDPFLALKGCGFMPEMVPYCGTVQRVCKPVRRFIDERDYKVKKVGGIYLLDGVMCEGTEPFGRCDRGCLYFWREEWLEPVSPGPG
jgi:hypothetical protein